MIKKIIISIAVAAVFLGAFSCGGPKVIPDNKLSDIFRDIYIVNAYSERQFHMQYDSIDIYEPVLKQYGYDTEDFLHTIANFNKRKSARFSDIINAAIVKMEDRLAGIEGRIRVLDFIDSTAYEISKEVVHTDSVIKIRSRADSALMTLRLPAEEGRYAITYYYYQDSTDRTQGLTNRHYVRGKYQRLLDSSTEWIKPGVRTLFARTLNAPEGVEELEITFGNYPQDVRKMHLTIDSLVIVHYLPREKALERLLRSYVDYTVTTDGKRYYDGFNHSKADSSTLHILPPLALTEPDSVVVE